MVLYRLEAVGGCREEEKYAYFLLRLPRKFQASWVLEWFPVFATVSGVIALRLVNCFVETPCGSVWVQSVEEVIMLKVIRRHY